MAAWIILVIGLAASLAGAAAWGATVRHQAGRSFTDTSSAVAGSINISLQRDNDVMATAGTLVATGNGLTNAQFQRWFTVLGSAHRYSGALAVAFMERVPRGQLSSFSSEMEADPPLGAPMKNAFTVNPPGIRPYYCFLRYAVIQFPFQTAVAVSKLALSVSFSRAIGSDSCDSSMSSILKHSAQSGQTSVAQLSTLLSQLGLSNTVLTTRIIDSIGGIPPVSFVGPVYADGSTSSPPGAHRADLLGWTEGIFNVHTVLSPAVGSLHGGAVTLSYDNPDGRTIVVSRVGTNHANQFSHAVRFDAGGPWTVTMSSPQNAWTDGTSPLVQGLIVGLLGLLLTVLLFFLVALLNRSRDSALDLVAEKTEELRYQALHDSLTDLPNRALILDRANHLLAQARRSRGSVALLFVDLDGFKSVNDSLGHRVGDGLLQTVAERFADALREVDTVGRLAGDEFVVLAEVANPEDATFLAQRLLDSLVRPVHVEDDQSVSLHVSASVGIATASSGSPEDLLRDADIALYQAKAAGKGRYVVFAPWMKGDFLARFDLEKDLQEAIEKQEFFLVFQPIVRLSDLSIVGAEALIRWQHPVRGVVAPLEFMEVLEDSGLIVDVGRWVLHESCRQAKTWHDNGYRISVSVNASAKQFEDSDFLDDVRSALKESGLRPSDLVIEITETALMREAEATTAKLHLLHQVGVHIAMDDFGTGYSSMAYLQRFPVDTIKIDRFFVTSMSESLESNVLLSLLVMLGNSLGISMLAEGIEQPEQLEILRTECCDRGQGYLFARPLGPHDMLNVLEKGIDEPLPSAARGGFSAANDGFGAVHAAPAAP